MKPDTTKTFAPQTLDKPEPTDIVKAPGGGDAVLGEVGKSGTYIFNGIITQEEYNSDLVRTAALKIYDQMRRGDGTVAAILLACKLPIIGAQWTLDAASDDPKDVFIRNFIARELMQRKVNFSDFMREGLTFFDFGYSVFEKVLEFTDFEGKQLIGLGGLHSRKQRSVYYWETEDHEPGITQVVIGGTYSIPRDKLVIFTLNKEGENYEGISLLRPAYKHWQIKDKLYLIDAIKHERQGLGVVGIKTPTSAHQSDIDNAIAAARNLRANEEAYIKTPEGFEIEFMDMHANTTTSVVESVLHHDRQISKSILGQFLELGASGGSGSRAVGDVQSELFMLSEEAAAKTFATVVQEDIIKKLVDLNFTDFTDYPKLKHSRIGNDDLVQSADAIQKLTAVNILTPDPDVEQSVRSMLHLPDLPDAYRADYNNRPKNSAPATGTPVDPNANGGGDGGDVSAGDVIAQGIKAHANIMKVIDAEYAKDNPDN
jgi:hypothetical protein